MANFAGYLQDKNGNKLFCDSYNIITGEEKETNEYVDGKRVWVKRITISGLTYPDTRITTGLSSSYQVQRYSGYVNIANQTWNLPFYFGDDAVDICIIESNTKIHIRCSREMGPLSGCVDIYYTK